MIITLLFLKLFDKTPKSGEKQYYRFKNHNLLHIEVHIYFEFGLIHRQLL